MQFISEYAHLYVSAAWLTLKIAFWGILFAMILGAFCSIVQYFRIPVIRRIVGVYIELSRNTPLLVQLYFIYYGLPKVGLSLSGEMCAVVGLIFLGGSYMSEAFRSGLDSVEKPQLESAANLGFSQLQTMQYVVFPQALATSVPALCANIVFMIKETSVVSAIAVIDLMYVAKDLIGLYYNTGEALFMLVVAYLLILLPISILATLLERRLRYAGFGN
ncbi:MAG: amino acid ABC transporter permease [Anaerovoracaceae bacterium]